MCDCDWQSFSQIVMVPDLDWVGREGLSEVLILDYDLNNEEPLWGKSIPDRENRQCMSTEVRWLWTMLFEENTSRDYSWSFWPKEKRVVSDVLES